MSRLQNLAGWLVEPPMSKKSKFKGGVVVRRGDQVGIVVRGEVQAGHRCAGKSRQGVDVQEVQAGGRCAGSTGRA